MANYEFKEVKCYPSDSARTETQDLWNDFGWEVTSMDTKQVRSGNMLVTHTYLQMRRDKEIQNHAKLKELQGKFEQHYGKSDYKYSDGAGQWWAAFAASFWILGLGFLLVPVAIIAGKNRKKYLASLAEHNAKAQEFRNQAKLVAK